METQNNILHLEETVPQDCYQERLDGVLAKLFADYSRSNFKKWILEQMVTVDGQIIDKPNHKLRGGEKVVVSATLEAQGDWEGEAMPLTIEYEDDALIIVNKPDNLVVHPGSGNASGTLVNGLLAKYPELAQLPRAGIIHRLDKDTTGLLVVARNLTAHAKLVEQLQEREFKREYLCLVQGVCPAGGTIDAPIGRHAQVRTRMAVTHGGKEAITHYRVVQQFNDYTLLRVRLETGRTHQIRVHMAHINLPIVGDPVYGGRLKYPAGVNDEWVTQLRTFRRQALHARLLGLTHPDSGEWMEWSVPLPQDFDHLLAVLETAYDEPSS